MKLVFRRNDEFRNKLHVVEYWSLDLQSQMEFRLFCLCGDSNDSATEHSKRLLNSKPLTDTAKESKSNVQGVNVTAV